MRTPSLQRRAVAYGVATVGVVVIVVCTIVYLALARSLEQTIDDALSLRADAAASLARSTTGTSELARALSERGIPATVRDMRGEAISAPVVRSRPGEELILSADRSDLAATTVDVGGGRQVTVLVNRSGANATLRRLLLFESLAAAVALLTAYLLLGRGTAAALAPLDEVVGAAQRTAAGHTGQRLAADDPDTELGRLAVAFDRMLDELESALDEARAAEERSRRFLADAAHQLRTPLASIRASVELLLIEPEPARRDDHLSHLLRETTRGTKVLNALLTLARLDRGRTHEPHQLDLAELCRDEVERARSLSPHLEITSSVAGDEATVTADGAALREALANLLDNARRHAASTVSVTVEVTAADGPVLGPAVRIEVADDGPGIPEGSVDLVFERFATLDGRGGSGLGLPIARAVAYEHGGDLTYDEGRFVLTLGGAPSADPASATPT